MEEINGTYTYYHVEGGQPVAVGRFSIENAEVENGEIKSGEIIYDSEKDRRNLGNDFPEGPLDTRMLYQIVYLETHSGYAFLKKT